MVKKILCMFTVVTALTLFSFAEEIHENITAESAQTQYQTEEQTDNPQQDLENQETSFEISENMDDIPLEEYNRPMFPGGQNGDMRQTGMPTDANFREKRPGGGMPSDFTGGIPFENQAPAFSEQIAEPEESPRAVKQIICENFTPICSMVLLAAAFVFVIFYKRKQF